MLDDRAIRRLAAMGIDAWVMRGRAAAAGGIAPDPAQLAREGGGPVPPAPAPLVLVVAAAGERLLADLQRALRMAGIDARITSGAAPPDAARGDPAARAAAIVVDAPRLRRDPLAKRRLWRDLLAWRRERAGTRAGGA